MLTVTCREADSAEVEGRDALPEELIDLRDRVQKLPSRVRTELEPIVAEVLDQARFRGRVLAIARDALVRLRLDLEMTRFDLDVTRREREELRRVLWGQD